jgi:hypothetical protein
MFEIIGDDIAALNDEDLRTLIGRLCEAELRRRELSTVAVTWGGNQTAKDGGLDVRVALPPEAVVDGFIPRRDTGFQVKKPDMPRGEILDEMKPKPKHELRPVIVDLANASGAYIIISSAGSTSDVALENRRKAMADAVKGIPNADRLTLDFYDRNRVATWVRDHAGLIPWVRSRIGKSIPGWRPYGSWSYRPDGADSTYLVDTTARIRTGDESEGDGISAVDGINRIRDALRTPGHVVRLVGLSGVGKTRFAEALFEPAVGVNALDPSLAVYADTVDTPDPQPGLLASDLVAARMRAILVIDNCPATINRQLAEIARQAGTTISVITIEYDIREDQPEGTDVFLLDPSSPELIEKLIEKRFPDFSQVERKTIADSSGGNARVALALAGTVDKNETVAGLNDVELFRRLFQQRNDPDAALLSIAQACSLVYSFNGEILDGDGAELPVLGGLVGKSADDVFAAAAELKQRHLLQARGPWRALLPHAIANRLAATALEKIPRQKLLPAFENGSARLLQSFSRRLAYLDRSKEAGEIVQGWLAPGGLLSDITNLNDLGRAMFENVAPVMPGNVLSALEKNLADADDVTLGECTHFIRLLRSLAYDPSHFERAVALLVRFVRLPSDNRSESEAGKIVTSLFHVVLSGTHAPLATRLRVVDRLLQSSDDTEQKLGAQALEAMLKTGHFMSVYNFEFGARSRDYGYYPPTRDDVRNWFSTVLDFAEPFALLDGYLAEAVRHAIAREFRGLWANVARLDELERTAHAVAAKGFWREGWIAARQTRIHDGAKLPADAFARIKALEEFLRPKDLIDKVRGVALNAKGRRSIDLDDLDEVQNDDYAAAMARASATVEALGRDVATDDEAFKALLPDLMGADGKTVEFGRGLGLAAENPLEMWRAMAAQLAMTKKPSIGLIGGFINGLQTRDRLLVDALMDKAVESADLAEWFPVLQTFIDIDDKGLARLHRALASGKAPIHTYFNLAYGRTCDAIPGPEFRCLVLAIDAMPGGKPVAIEILSMRLHPDGNEKKVPVPEVAEVGRQLLDTYDFQRVNNRAQSEDYELGVIVRASLVGDEGKPIVRKLCRGLLSAAASYSVSAHDYDDLMQGLLKVHPSIVLDELVRGDETARNRSVEFIRDSARFNKNPIDVVSDDTMIAWCDLDAKTRYPFAAAIAPLFHQTNDENPRGWKAIARTFLTKAPDKRAVFNEIVSRLYDAGDTGSLSTQYESRLKLLDRLDLSGLPLLASPLAEARGALQSEVEMSRKRETERDRTRSGTFE